MTSLTTKQYATLAALFAGASTPAEVLEITSLPHCCMTIDALEEKGLVETDVDDAHRNVDLTAEGAKVARSIFAAA